MCLAVGSLQLRRLTAHQEEAARRQAAQPHPLRRAAAQEPEDDRLAQHPIGQTGGAPAGARQEVPPEVAERRLRPAARPEEGRQQRETVPGRPELGQGLRQRVRVLRELPERRQRP